MIPTTIRFLWKNNAIVNMKHFKNPFITSISNFTDMQILNLGAALPKNEYSTEKLLETFPCSLPERVKQNVLNLGVQRRYLINHPDAKEAMNEDAIIELCSEACENAVQNAGLSAKDINYFIAAYDATPFLSPGLSQLLVRNIGFTPYIKHVNAQGIASTAFPKALELAENYLAAHPKDYALICVSGVSSYWFQNQVRGMTNVMEIRQINQIKSVAKRRVELQKWVATMEFFLFGDGAAACVVANKGEGLTVEKNVEVTNVGKKDYLAGYAKLSASNKPFSFGFYSHLDRKIPELGVKYTSLALKRLFGKTSRDAIKMVKKWAVHTGSEKILAALAERNEIPYEKIKESHEILREYGNLAGASLPFILERIISNTKLVEEDVITMLGYGWGFSAAACLLKFKH
ncbi:MAG: 3-oxoacyl-[acyl-carrier-protein] synthase III C-terminal domain-containing protein [Candidatus Bathyarchaeia archaeon]